MGVHDIVSLYRRVVTVADALFAPGPLALIARTMTRYVLPRASFVVEIDFVFEENGNHDAPPLTEYWYAVSG